MAAIVYANMLANHNSGLQTLSLSAVAAMSCSTIRVCLWCGV